jgi:hypothetical protein
MRRKKRDNPLLLTIIFLVLVFGSVYITVELVNSNQKERSGLFNFSAEKEAEVIVPHLEFAASHVEAKCLIYVRKAYPKIIGLHVDFRSTIQKGRLFKVFIVHSKGSSNYSDSVYVCGAEVEDSVINVYKIFENRKIEHVKFF